MAQLTERICKFMPKKLQACEHDAECCYADCHYTECRHAQCSYAQCSDALTTEHDLLQP